MYFSWVSKIFLHFISDGTEVIASPTYTERWGGERDGDMTQH